MAGRVLLSCYLFGLLLVCGLVATGFATPEVKPKLTGKTEAQTGHYTEQATSRALAGDIMSEAGESTTRGNGKTDKEEEKATPADAEEIADVKLDRELDIPAEAELEDEVQYDGEAKGKTTGLGEAAPNVAHESAMLHSEAPKPLPPIGRVLLLTHHIGSHTAEAKAIGAALSRNHGYQIYMAVSRNYSKREKMEAAGFNLLYYDLPPGLMRTDSVAFREWFTENLFSGKSQLEFFDDVSRFMMEECTHMMRDTTFLKAVKALDFSMAVYDGYILTACRSILPHYLGIPHVYEFSELPVLLPGLRLSPAFIPGAIADHYSHDMTLMERASNVISHFIEGYGFVSAVRNDSLLREFGRGTVTTWSELMARSELFIVTRDHLLEWPVPALPNVIVLPGITYSPGKPLPSDFEDVMNKADRVALVTIGSTAHIDLFPAHIMSRMLRGFSLVPRVTFLMQYPVSGGRRLSDRFTVPDNVRVFDWLPQNDVLGHPKTVLFVTHCGNNGQYEALYHGVPMVGIPLFAEQPGNCFRIRHHDLGICLDTDHFQPTELAEAVRDITDVERTPFANNTKKRASILKSFPMAAADTAAFWIDHVIRFGGDHLRSPAATMPTYKLYMLDLVALLLLVIVAMETVLFLILRAIWRRCCRKTKPKQA